MIDIKHIHPVHFLNTIGNELQKPIIVDSPVSYQTETSAICGFELLRLGYRDGTQNGNVLQINGEDYTILNYRGEFIIKDKKTGSYLPLRVSLPVSPETSQLNKFASHSTLFNYLKGLEPFLSREFTRPKIIPDFTKYNKCYMMEKVDGSLMVASCVKKNSPQGTYILSIKDIAGKWLVEVGDYLVYFGSKSCLFMSLTLDYEEEFYKCITASFVSIEALALLVKEYLETLSWDETASVIFEMVPEYPHQGLTVAYGHYFTSHLSTIVFSHLEPSNIKIILPDEVSSRFFQGVKVVELECSAKSIAQYYCDKLQEALDGKLVDLEGFMAVFQSNDGSTLYVKIKFSLFFSAHDPVKYFIDAEELYTNPKYDKIRDRLVNLGLTTEKRRARLNPTQVFEPCAILLSEAFTIFNEEYKPKNKKDFMISLKEKPNFFKTYQGIEDAIKEALSKLSMNIECSIDKIVPLLYTICIGLYTTHQKIELIKDLLIKTWKINEKLK